MKIMKIKFDEVEKINRNLYIYNKHYYKLFASGVTPNGCWVVNALLREIIDIESESGTDVFGSSMILFGEGEVSSSNEFIKVGR